MPASSRKGARFVALGLFAVFLIAVAYCVAVLFNVRAYSDPANWLHYARNLKTEFSTTKWPVLYPLFLIACEKITGPITIFLANLPVVILLLAGMGAVASRAMSSGDREERPALSPWPMITTAFLVLAFDPHLLVYLVNPYRDPLGLLLRVSSVLVLILSVQPHRRRGAWLLAWVSGLLLGVSAAVREPGVLMVLPMLVFGIWVSLTAPHIRFLQHAISFGVGLLMGISPPLVQTLVVTGQMVKPAQSVADAHLVPGMEVSLAAKTTAQALEYYLSRGVWLPVVALAGAVMGMIRRNRISLCLLVLPCLLYAGFYCFYWTFVPRYFYFPTLCMGALGACFLHEQAAIWSKRIPSQSRVAWQAGVSIVVVGLSLFSLGRVEPDRDRFTTAAAHNFAEWVDRMVSADGVVFTQRNLCELGRILGQRESRPLREAMPDECYDALPAKALVDRLIAEGRNVFVAEFSRSRRSPFELCILGRFYDVVQVAEEETAAFALPVLLGTGPIVLHRIEPWEGTSSACLLASRDRSDGDVLTVEGAAFTRAVPGAQSPALWVGGDCIAESVPDGLSFLRIPRGTADRLDEAEMRSESPLPSQFAATLGDSRTDAFIVDLGFASRSDSTRFLTGMGETFRHGPRVVRLAADGTIGLPPIWDAGTVVMATILFNGPTYAVSNAPVLSLSYPESPRLQLRAARRRVYHRAGLLATVTDGAESIGLSLAQGAWDEPDPPWIDIDELLVRAVDPEWALPVTVAPGGDDWLAASGFYRDTTAPDGTLAAWTDGCGQVWLCVPPEGRVEVTVRFWGSILPSPLRSRPVRLLWNGQPLETAMDCPGGEPLSRAVARIATVRGTKPYGLLTVESDGWRPSDLLATPDTRTLGIMIKDVHVEPQSTAQASGD